MVKKNKTIIFFLAALIILGLTGYGIFLFLNMSNDTNEKQIKTDDEKFGIFRNQMIEHQIIARGIEDKKVLEAMRKVPRHEFVDRSYRGQAYDDRPLPIGMGQTISQPYIVALMTENLELKRGEKVLEIGTGSGYQAAILAEITPKVYTVEIIPSLYENSKKALLKQGYNNIKISNHDGYFGWKEHAPFDKIIVTAAPDHIPQPLIDQLKEGGIMVIPVGPPGWSQVLWKVIKEDKDVKTVKIADVAFVPLTREESE